MHRAHLPKSRHRPHEEILDDDEERDYEEIKDYEEAHPRPHRGGDRQLGGLGERNYQAGHHVAGNAGGLQGHPIREKPMIGPGTHPPRGPHSAMDQEELGGLIEDDLEELDEQVTLLEADIDLAALDEDPRDHLAKPSSQPKAKKRYPGKYRAGRQSKADDVTVRGKRGSRVPVPWAGNVSDGS